jgi:hypothetical protein
MRTVHGVVGGWTIAGVVLALAGCEGHVLELAGSGADSGSPSVASASTESYGGIAGAAACTLAPKPVPDAGGAAGAALAPLVGTWTGYAETSDNMTLVFTQEADGSVSGSLTFGMGSPPAPPTSGNDAYPPGSGGDANSVPFPYIGFPYTASDVSFDGTRLQLAIVTNELWKAWCGLQKSFDWSPDAPGMCGCLPDWGGMGSGGVGSGGMGSGVTGPTGSCSINDPTTGAAEAIPCPLVGPCIVYAVCSCDATGCSVDMQNASTKLDVQLAGDKLDGSIAGLPQSPLNVHFTRSP